MKILILSDSHGDGEALCLAAARTGPELILHLGDHDWDCAALHRRFPQIPVRAVRGNCDLMSGAPVRDEFAAEGKRIFMTHGHLYHVKTGMDAILTAASVSGADILLYGHTHIPFYAERDGLHILNPGSVGRGKKTYAVLDLQHGAVQCEILTL